MTASTSTSRIRPIAAKTPVVTNLSMPVAGTEYSHTFASKTKRFLIRARNLANIQFAYVSTESTTKFITIPCGGVYSETDLDLSSVTIYMQSDVASQTAEILEWS